MTYEERRNKLCEECGQADVCGYYLHSTTDRCIFITNVMSGWNLDKIGTLAAVKDYVDRGNSTFTEEFIEGFKEYLKNKNNG